MSWLEHQKKELLERWLRGTRSPMLASLPDGTILWANQAFEELIGYTNVELENMSWKDLTRNEVDLEADEQLVAQLVTGDRLDYSMQKEYVTKSGPTVRVVIDVLRYPIVGDFKCCLVSAIPIHQGIEFAMGELVAIRQMLIQIIQMTQDEADKTCIKIRPEDVSYIFKQKPYLSTFVILLLCTLLFGERVMELLKLIGINFGS